MGTAFLHREAIDDAVGAGRGLLTATGAWAGPGKPGRSTERETGAAGVAGRAMKAAPDRPASALVDVNAYGRVHECARGLKAEARLRVVIGGPVDVFEKAGAGGLPAEKSPGTRTGSGHVRIRHHGKPAEMFSRARLDGKTELAADDRGGLLERNCLVGDRVIGGIRCALFQREPIDAGRVQPGRRRRRVTQSSQVSCWKPFPTVPTPRGIWLPI